MLLSDRVSDLGGMKMGRARSRFNSSNVQRTDSEGISSRVKHLNRFNGSSHSTGSSDGCQLAIFAGVLWWEVFSGFLSLLFPTRV